MILSEKKTQNKPSTFRGEKLEQKLDTKYWIILVF